MTVVAMIGLFTRLEQAGMSFREKAEAGTKAHGEVKDEVKG